MFLNRPLIMLLEHLGVVSDVIIDLQSTSIREVQTIQTSLNQATKVFLQHNLGASYHLPSLFNNISRYLGLDIYDRPVGGLQHHLIKEALYCAATHALREIKYRAHILVPDSVTLLGVSDEYDCLEEGEIFATVYDESKKIEQSIEGKVLITRSPQVHPGDVQLVTAVLRPELTHLKNVVVFSCRCASPSHNWCHTDSRCLEDKDLCNHALVAEILMVMTTTLFRMYVLLVSFQLAINTALAKTAPSPYCNTRCLYAAGTQED